MHKIRISLCTVCMNRLHHLKHTLKKNIECNLNHPNFEFVLLNYNSSDNLNHWIRENFSHYLEKKVLVYYQTKEPKYFHMSHAKNVAVKCSSGEIVCNIDADNFTGKDFVYYVDESFKNDKNIFITASQKLGSQDTKGRLCLRRDDFDLLTGYDESMVDYGFEDVDLINRLILLGRKKIQINNPFFLQAIKHSDSERLAFQNPSSETLYVFVSHITPSISIFIYILKYGKFKMAEIIDNYSLKAKDWKNLFFTKSDYQYSLGHDKWIEGTWTSKGSELSLRFNDGIVIHLNYESLKGSKVTLGNHLHTFNKVISSKLLATANMFKSQITNRIKMDINSREKSLCVNHSFGKARLIRNFGN